MMATALTATMALSLFAGGAAYAGLRDVLTMKISNRLVVVLLVSFLALAPLSGMNAEFIGLSVAGGLAVLVAGFLLFAMNWFGGGDAKFAAVVAMWLGPLLVLPFLFQTALFGGGVACLLLVARRLPIRPSWAKRKWLVRLHAPETGVPYAVPMAAAALILLPQTEWAALLR